MDLDTFIVTVFCMIDDWMKERPKLRERGPQPTLHDSGALTIEVIGAFLGISTDKGLSTLSDTLGHSSVGVTRDFYAVFNREELRQKHDQHSRVARLGCDE